MKIARVGGTSGYNQPQLTTPLNLFTQVKGSRRVGFTGMCSVPGRLAAVVTLRSSEAETVSHFTNLSAVPFSVQQLLAT